MVKQISLARCCGGGLNIWSDGDSDGGGSGDGGGDGVGDGHGHIEGGVKEGTRCHIITHTYIHTHTLTGTHGDTDSYTYHTHTYTPSHTQCGGCSWEFVVVRSVVFSDVPHPVVQHWYHSPHIHPHSQSLHPLPCDMCVCQCVCQCASVCDMCVLVKRMAANWNQYHGYSASDILWLIMNG